MTVLLFPPKGKLGAEKANVETSPKDPLLNQDGEVRLPSAPERQSPHRHQRRADRMPNVRHLRPELSDASNDKCPESIIADTLGISLDEIRARGPKTKSPALRLCREGETPIELDDMAIRSAGIDIDRPQHQPVIEIARDLLSPQEFMIFCGRFINEEPVSAQALAKSLGITAMEVERIEAVALRKMMRGRVQN